MKIAATISTMTNMTVAATTGGFGDCNDGHVWRSGGDGEDNMRFQSQYLQRLLSETTGAALATADFNDNSSSDDGQV